MHGNVFIMELTGNPLSPLQMHTVDKHPLHAWKHNTKHRKNSIKHPVFMQNSTFTIEGDGHLLEATL